MPNFLFNSRGHGTFTEDEKLHSSVAGAIDRVNKLICVKPLKTRLIAMKLPRSHHFEDKKNVLFRYNGEVGDVVVGRITEVGQKRWKVETNSRLDSMLLLSSVNLPGGELVRFQEIK